jgi:hypothetical protein
MRVATTDIQRPLATRLWPLQKSAWAGLLTLFCGCGSFSYFQFDDAGSTALFRDGGVDAGTVHSTDGGLSKSMACSVLNATRCQYLERCGLIDETGFRSCLEGLSKNWCGPSTWPSRLAASPPTLRYDAVRAQACADSFANLSCSLFEEEPTACKEFLIPNVALGLPCFDGFSECAQGVCRGAVCPKTCQTQGVVDEVCSQNEDCRGDLYCRNIPNRVGRCTAYASEKSVCDEFTLCADNLPCLRNACTRLPGPYTPCNMGLCNETATCVPAADGGVCLPKKLSGESCRPDECTFGFFCGPAARCEPLDVPDAGLPCVAGQQCPTGTTCVAGGSRDAGFCAPFQNTGTPCSASTECLPELACLGRDGGITCQPRLPRAAPCRETRDCQLSQMCLKGLCLPIPSVGQSCNETKRCLFGNCVAGAQADGGLVCENLWGATKVCGSDQECASGRCINNTCAAVCAP